MAPLLYKNYENYINNPTMISVITCTYNRARQFRRGISTILSQEFLPDEIVVIDDGSVDETRATAADLNEIARAKGVDFKYIYLNHPEPRISCIPHNVGIKAAKGDILIFTESEALHVGNTIERIVSHLTHFPDEVPLATQIWTMGAKAYASLPEDSFAHPENILVHEYAQLTDSTNMQNTKAPDADWGITGSINCYAGVLFGCYKKDIMAIGGYNEDFKTYGWDDWDVLKRLQVYGKKTIWDNNIPVIHQWHEKNYAPDIYEAAERNGKISEEMINSGLYEVNKNRKWGEIS